MIVVVAVAGISLHTQALLKDSITLGSAVSPASNWLATFRASDGASAGLAFGAASRLFKATVGEAVTVATTVFVFLIILVMVLNLVVTALVVVLFSSQHRRYF